MFFEQYLLFVNYLVFLIKLFIIQVFFRKCQEQGLRNLENQGVYFRK
jgi:hypothetical protein